jgi:hypothetical protein
MIYGEEDFNDTLLKVIKGPEDKAYRHSCYHECCEHAKEMSWHLYGDKPIDLLEKVRPNEPEEVTNYRLNNYEPKTKAAADKAINITSKIFNPNLYSIRYKDQTSSGKKLEEYTGEYYPVYNSLVNYTKDVLLRKMLADPNGVVTVKLQQVPSKQTEQPKPILTLYGSRNVWNYDDEHYLIHIKTEEEKVDQKLITWFFFEYYDHNQFIYFRVYVTGNDELVREEIEVYPYNFGEIPVWKLKGMSEAKDNGEIIYKSFFASAVPFWNDAITHESDVKASFIGHIHPQKYEISETCNYIHDYEGMKFKCRGGTISFGKNDEHGTSMDCPGCGGTGYRNMAGPLGVYKFSKEKLSEGDTPSGLLPVGYVTVPIDATKMLEERAERMRQLGMWAINMDVEDEVGENQSGVAKVIDRSAQYDTLFNIATVIFDDHLANAYYFFNKYMFGVSDRSVGGEPDKNLPEINKPTHFDILTSTEMVNNFKAAKDSGLDPNFLQIKQTEILTRDLTTNPDLKKFGFLLLDLDPLPGMDAQTVSMNQSKGYISLVDAVVHNNLKRFLEKAMHEDNKFMERPKHEQIEIIEKMGEEFAKKNKPKIDPEVMNYAQAQTKKAQTAAV